MESYRSCTNCAGTNLHPSRRRGWKDTVMTTCGYEPWRCHACNKRLYLRTSKLSSNSSKRHLEDVEKHLERNCLS